MTILAPLPSQRLEMARAQLATSEHLLRCLLDDPAPPANEFAHLRRLARLAIVIFHQRAAVVEAA